MTTAHNNHNSIGASTSKSQAVDRYLSLPFPKEAISKETQSRQGSILALYLLSLLASTRTCNKIAVRNIDKSAVQGDLSCPAITGEGVIAPPYFQPL